MGATGHELLVHTRFVARDRGSGVAAGMCVAIRVHAFGALRTLIGPMTKLTRYTPDSHLLGPYHQKSTMPRITLFEPKPAARTGAVKVAPRPLLAGVGVKRSKP